MARRANPKREYPRMVRVNELLREVIAEAVQDVDDERMANVAITSVDCETDLGAAVVHYDVLEGPDADEEVQAAFSDMRARLQKAINAETRLKQTPRLTFAADPVVRSAARIDDVLRQINEGGSDEGGSDEGGSDEAPPAP